MTGHVVIGKYRGGVLQPTVTLNPLIFFNSNVPCVLIFLLYHSSLPVTVICYYIQINSTVLFYLLFMGSCFNV